MLRGAFGHALRTLACMTKQKDCAGCPLLATCPYPAIFAPPPPAAHALQKFSQIPVPYVIEPPAWGARQINAGEPFAFHMTLIGRALRELPLIVLAWRRACARGVGAGDGRAELVRVVHCACNGEAEIHRPDTGAIAPHAQALAFESTADNADAPRELTLRFVTPLRLQKNGHALAPDKLDARTLLMALVRRANLVAEFHAGVRLTDDFAALHAASAQIQESKHLVWLDWTRFSSRQRKKMALGGAVGDWTLRGALDPFVPYLRLGEWLHVGKEAAFGLGRYTLEMRQAAHNFSDGVNVRDCASQGIGEKEKINRDQFV